MKEDLILFIKLSNGQRHEIGKPFTPDIYAIAFALSHINRYTGHVGQYSVAQHCVLVSQHLPYHLKMSGLLHDATEAYIGDVAAPLKQMIASVYGPIEAHYHRTIDDHFCVNTEHELVKEIDKRILITEAKHFGLWDQDWPDYEPINNCVIAELTPFEAMTLFMEHFTQYDFAGCQ